MDFQIPEEESKIMSKYRLPYMTNAPIDIFRCQNLEEMAFPKLYPYGTHGLKYDRFKQPTIAEYFKCRLLNKDTRWASTPNIYFGHYTFMTGKTTKCYINYCSTKNISQ